MAGFALHITARVFDRSIHRAWDGGGQLVVRDGELPVPLPAGWPFLLRAQRLGAVVRITDGGGGEHRVGTDAPLVLAIGDTEVEIAVAPRRLLRRTAIWSWAALAAWFTTTSIFSVGAGAVATLEAQRCEWLPILFPYLEPAVALYQADPTCNPPDQGQASGVSGVEMAEYLARLLRDDLDGVDDGVLTPPVVDPTAQRGDSFYMPAGNDGPKTEMGGAAKVAPRPVRAAEAASGREGPPVPDQTATAEGAAGGTPVAGVDPTQAPTVSGDAGEAEGTEEADPAEDKLGWGVRDWYDRADQNADQVEIVRMKALARERLRLDPTDLDGLQTLSYYQYLQQDYAGAEATYQKMLDLVPEAGFVWNNRALIKKRRGDYASEESDYRRALDLEPGDVTAMNNLAVCLAHQGRFAEAEAIMDQLAVLDPEDAYADLHRAKIAAAKGDDEAAYLHLEQALHRMAELDTLHHIEFRQDIRVDPAFARIRSAPRFHAILVRYYGKDDAPVPGR